MKQKNLPDDIESKSLDELKEILNNLVEKIEKNKVSNQSEEDYLEIFKLNNFKLTKQLLFNKNIGQKGKLSQIIKLLVTKLEQKNFFKPPEKRSSMIKNINNLQMNY